MKPSLRRLELVLSRFLDDNIDEAANAIRAFREICLNHGIDVHSLRFERNETGALTRDLVAYETAELRAVITDLEKTLRILQEENSVLRRGVPSPQLAPLKKPRKTRNEPVPNFAWTSEQLKIATELFLSGRKNEEICAAVGCNPNQVLARFNNGPPTMTVEVPAEGPITWAEAWQIGHDLYRKGWISKVINKLGIKKGACKPPQDINLQTTPREIAALRDLWRSEMATKKRRRRMPTKV